MSRSSWLLSCCVCLLLGGLAVWAGEKIKHQSPAAAAGPAAMVEDAPRTSAYLPAAATPEPDPPPIQPVVLERADPGEPPPPMPVEPFSPVQLAPPPAPETPPSAPPALPPVPEPTPLPPPAAEPSTPPIPSLPPAPVPVPPQAAAPSLAPPVPPPPAVPVEPVPPTAVAAPCPWNLHLELVDGRTRLEARTGNEVRCRILCDRLELQTPHGRLQAHGDVRITGVGLAGNCDHLVINWQDDKILLEGQVRFKCEQDGQDVIMTADCMSFQLSKTRLAQHVDDLD